MCKVLAQETCYECKIKFKGAHDIIPVKEYTGVAITCKCGSTEYFVSPLMPFHKIILPFDRRWIKGVRKLLSKVESKRNNQEYMREYMRKRNKLKRVDK